MSRLIRNYEQLIGHGYTKGREIVLAMAERGISAVNTYENTKRLIHIDGQELKTGSTIYDLREIGKIYLIGAGKGSFLIAQALDEILGKRIEEGVVSVKKAENRRLEDIQVVEAGHPIPDKMSEYSAKRAIEIAKKAKENDLVFTPITGGSSSLMSLPVSGITLKDIKDVNLQLLNSGAAIKEMNAIRKHLSAIKGGRLVQDIHPAKMIVLTLDTTLEIPRWWPDLALPDSSTFKEAIKVLENYNLWRKIPESVKKHFLRGLTDPSLETPKSFKGMKVEIHNLGNQATACEAALRKANGLGVEGWILSTNIEGEAREVGTAIAGVAKEINRFHRPIKPPCVLISGGETTVAVIGRHGKGGPNQEFVLGFARKIRNYKKIVALSIDTDGIDGASEMAGGIVDDQTMRRAKEKGIDIFEELRRHNSSHVLSTLGDAIMTGESGTNVMDLRIIFIDVS